MFMLLLQDHSYMLALTAALYLPGRRVNPPILGSLPYPNFPQSRVAEFPFEKKTYTHT